VPLLIHTTQFAKLPGGQRIRNETEMASLGEICEPSSRG
jgi:hypothetical protein